MRLIEAQELKGNIHIAIVVSRYNQGVTQALLEGALERLNELDFSEDRITVIWVPGAVEIPLAAQRLAKTGAYESIICFGTVIKGETYHFDFVCEQVSQGCQRVMLENDIPVLFGVLMTETLAQAQERIGGSRGHMGRECVDSAVSMLSVLRQIA